MTRRPYRKKSIWGIGILCLLILLLTGMARADTKTISGTTNVEDAMIWSGSRADNNYGDMGNSDLTISTSQFILIRVKNVAAELGENAIISAGVCSIYCVSEVLGAKTLNADRALKPWVEGDENGVNDDDGDVTWNDWASDEYEWGTAGGECENNDGVDNSQDGTCDASGRDRITTREDYASVDATGWFTWDISAELAQAWYDGTANENGIHINTGSSGSSTWRGTEAASNQPRWGFTYTTNGEEPASKVFLIGARYEENSHNPRLGIPPAAWE